MSKILITGGAGFIGSHLCEKLLDKGHKITILDDLSTGSLKNLSNILDDVQFIKGSVTNIPEDVLSQKFDGIFNLAMHPRSFSLSDPITNLEVNAKGMINVLELAKKNNSKVIFSSNSGIYGEPKYIPVDENHSVNPKTPYDANKLVSEYYCTIYHNIYGIDTVIFRFATVFGERQKVNLKLNWKPVIAEFCWKIINNQQPIIYGDGNQTRDFIYVNDVVDALVKCYESDIRYGLFNLGTSTETSINQLLQTINKLNNTNIIAKREAELPGDIRRCCYSYKKLSSAIGFEPKYSLEEGIKRYLLWLKEQRVEYLNMSSSNDLT